MSITGEPFLVFGLPRSRTFWASRFLTYGGYECAHDQSRYFRSLDDVRSWLSLNGFGSVETAAAPWWRLALKYRPGLRVAVIRRPVEACVESAMRVGRFDAGELRRMLRRLDAKLDQIEQRVPGVVSVQFERLREAGECARLFEHCTGYPFDARWWTAHDVVNLQSDMGSMQRYVAAYRPQIDRIAALCTQAVRADLTARPVRDIGGVTYQQETFDRWFDDARDLMRAHCALVGEHPDNWERKNWAFMRVLARYGCLQIVTARSNGRMFGYVLTIVGPSLEDPTVRSAEIKPVFVSPDAPGVGVRLQRASLNILRERGVTEVFARAGERGDGPRMGTLWRRLGGVEFGRQYRIELEKAA